MYTENIPAKTSISIRLDSDMKELLTEAISNYENTTGQEVVTDRQMFNILLEGYLSKKRPVEKSKKEDQEKIASLSAELEKALAMIEILKSDIQTHTQNVHSLQTKVDSFNTHEENLQTEYNRMQTEVNHYSELCAGLSAELEAAQNQISEQALMVEALQNSELPENVIPVSLNPFQLELFKKYVADKHIIAYFRKANANGQGNGIAEPIDTPNERQNLANFMTGTVIGSMFGKVLYEVYSADQLNRAFDRFKKSIHE